MVHLYDALHGSQSRGTLDARRISKISAEQYWDKPAVPPQLGFETASNHTSTAISVADSFEDFIPIKFGAGMLL